MRPYLLLLLMVSVVAAGCGGAVDDLKIAPSSVTLSPGDKQVFKVVGGPPVPAVDPMSLAWDCTGGTLDWDYGLSVEYTAGYETGDYTISVSGSSLYGSASIQIR